MQKSTSRPVSGQKPATATNKSVTAYKTRKATTMAKKPAQTANKPQTATAKAAKSTPPVPSASTASPFEIMAARIANRVADMAENITFSERAPSKPGPAPTETSEVRSGPRKAPRKLDMRLQRTSADSVKFSAPFLDNTLAKMLDLQNRMLRTSSQIAASEATEAVKREQFEQSAELSRIIALICAEKARQGA